VLYKTYGSFPIILGIKENSPAELEGLKLGESISAIDGRSTLTMSMLEANLYLKHKQKQTVSLKLIRSQKNTTINLECKVLYKIPFSFSPAAETSGILKIHTFSPLLVKMLKKNILPGLKGKKKILILDLRTCWEGTIPEAIKFINLFLQKNNVGYFKGNNKEKEYISCQETAELKKLPLVIWTNQATIGPAEIVAGVLKNHAKAKVIGTRTPGLAAKQDFFLMEDGSGIVLTSAIFQLNKNEELWQKGIEPDIKIDSTLQDSRAYLKETYKIIPNK
jgi:C-terminal peptidase prc